MKDKVYNYINDKGLSLDQEKLILAISGGADSVCLMHILLDLGFNFELAHCNFNLRGNESDKDEEFIRNLSDKYNLKLHCKNFDVSKYRKIHKVSVQMAARDLRYIWFNDLLESQKAKYILIAHNQNDSIETFFINLIRGSGISGLTGINPKNNKIVRPLLSCDRIEIEEYLAAKKQSYREDSSNSSLKYLRNKVRHQLLPLLEEFNPNIQHTLLKEINILKETKQLVNNYILKTTEKIVEERNGVISINIHDLMKINNLNIYLFETLKKFGFTQVKDIILALNSQSGKHFFSKSHQLIIDRKKILISKINKQDFLKTTIHHSERAIKYPVQLNFSIVDSAEINNSEHVGQFAFDKLTFPLTLRKWKKGDKFKPLGMNSYKKLSDFFIDNKFSRLQKQKQWLLCSEGEIIWVVGCRIDNRFKVQSETKKLYIAELIE